MGGGGHSRQMATGLCEMEYAIGILIAYSGTSLYGVRFSFWFQTSPKKSCTPFSFGSPCQEVIGLYVLSQTCNLTRLPIPLDYYQPRVLNFKFV